MNKLYNKIYTEAERILKEEYNLSASYDDSEDFEDDTETFADREKRLGEEEDYGYQGGNPHDGSDYQYGVFAFRSLPHRSSGRPVIINKYTEYFNDLDEAKAYRKEIQDELYLDDSADYEVAIYEKGADEELMNASRRYPVKNKRLNAGLEAGKVTAENLVNYIMDFEEGALEDADTLELFSYLVKSGQAWTLQGMYGRTAQSLIDQGYLNRDGEILKFPSNASRRSLSIKPLNAEVNRDAFYDCVWFAQGQEAQEIIDSFHGDPAMFMKYFNEYAAGVPSTTDDGEFLTDRPTYDLAEYGKPGWILEVDESNQIFALYHEVDVRAKLGATKKTSKLSEFLQAEGGACPESGCTRQVGGKWRVISDKTGDLWGAEYDTEEKAKDAIKAYHAQKGK